MVHIHPVDVVSSKSHSSARSLRDGRSDGLLAGAARDDVRPLVAPESVGVHSSVGLITHEADGTIHVRDHADTCVGSLRLDEVTNREVRVAP